MIKIPQEDSDLLRKQEGGGGGDDSSSNYHEKAKASSSSFMEPKWVRLQDPRIVRVARAYGSKDRHSKVCTIRGLRDRRVRLSVPTAIQLYDLQERLRFNQPSKVIDWLLNAAKNDIDELPPLPPLNLALVHHHHHDANITTNSSQQPNEEEEEDGLEAFNNNHTFWKLIEPKEASSSHDDVKQGSRNNDDDLSNPHPRPRPRPHPHHHPSYVRYRQRENSVAGGASEGEHVSHQTDLQSLNVVPFSSTLSLSTTPADSSSHHFPSSHFGANIDMDHNNIPSQVNYNYHHPMLMSSIPNNLYPMFMPQSRKPFGLSMVTTPPNNNTAESHQSYNHPQNFPTK